MKSPTITQLRPDHIFWTQHPPKDRPCARCPFLRSNFDKVGEPPHENEGTYWPSTRADLWNYGARQDGCTLGNAEYSVGPAGADGLRGTNTNACHIRREVRNPEGARLAHVIVNECTSTAVLQQRELLRRVQHGPQPHGLTDKGAAHIASNMLGRRVRPRDVDRLDVAELVREAHPALLDPNIGHELLRPVSDEEREAWAPAAELADAA